MRHFAIGDIHGCRTALETLLANVPLGPDDVLVALGDFIDRGPDSRGVLELLIELHDRGRLVPLLGNHEEMLLLARHDLAMRDTWLRYGGQATLASYASQGGGGALDDIPQAHWDFLQHTCRESYVAQDHIFVHAGVTPAQPLDEQTAYALRWQKFYAPERHVSGQRVICGHTAQKNGWPLVTPAAVCIDTWIYGDGWLTCLDPAAGCFWQANERGQTRTGELPPVQDEGAVTEHG